MKFPEPLNLWDFAFDRLLPAGPIINVPAQFPHGPSFEWVNFQYPKHDLGPFAPYDCQ